MSLNPHEVRARIESILLQRCGRVDEKLLGGGLLDSLRAVEFALVVEREFQLAPDSFRLADLVTVSRLVERVVALGATSPF